MIRSTLCYIEKNGHYLMLYRNKKKEDMNAGKWLGIGGKFEAGEDEFTCVKREVYEETGLKLPLSAFVFKGRIEFRSDKYEEEDMYLFEASPEDERKANNDTDGDRMCVPECNEGTLKWIKKNEILSLNLWEGDRYFIEPLIRGEKEINLRLIYKGDSIDKVEKL